jgi:hypothetical protein
VAPDFLLSTSFVLAALPALHVDRFGKPRAAGSYPGMPMNFWSGPPCRVVGCMVTHECVGDPVGAVGHRARYDPAVFAPCLESSCAAPARWIVEPHSHAQIDQGPAECHTARAADRTIASFPCRLILGRGQARGPVDLRRPGPAVRITRRPAVVPGTDHTPARCRSESGERAHRQQPGELCFGSSICVLSSANSARSATRTSRATTATSVVRASRAA